MGLRLPAVGGGLDDGQLRRALALFADPAAGCQVHGLPSGRFRTVAGNDIEGLVVAVRALAAAGDRNLYYSLNPVPVSLDRSARNADVLGRRWLLIDLDPVKPQEFADDPATEEEHRRVGEAANDVIDYLSDRGWPLPVLVDSGNGYHVLYRIDLPASDHARALVKGSLKALVHLEQGRAHVGVECHDARRIAKLPGSVARKGTPSVDRPYRPVLLLSAPDPVEVVPVELLQTLAVPPPIKESAGVVPATRPAPTPERWGALRGKAGAPGGRRWALAALERERQRIRMARPGTAEGRNVCLNRAAYALAGFVAGGHLSASEVEEALRGAALDAGLGDWEVGATFRSGFTAGEAAPRQDHALNGSAPRRPAATPRQEESADEVVTIRASEITPQKVHWLWPGRLPLGKLTTFAGIGGLGKTFVLLDIAARVSLGADWPNGGQAVDGEVLFVSGEDDPDDTLVPRLIEMKADLNRVRFLRPHALDRFTLKDLDMLERAMGECEGPLRLVVIDPPTAYLHGVDDHKNAELRQLLTPLKEWAKHAMCALVFNTHVNKSTQKVEAMARVMGSVAWVNAVRAAHLFARDPDDEQKVLFVPMKTNLGPPQKAIAYRIEVVGDLARVEWLGEVDTTADQAINHRKGPTRKAVASEWLIERFREKREWESEELMAAARAHGISRNAIFDAKDALCLPKARKVTTQAGHSSWVWRVPEDWPPLATVPDTRTVGTVGTLETNSLREKELELSHPSGQLEGSGQLPDDLCDLPW